MYSEIKIHWPSASKDAKREAIKHMTQQDIDNIKLLKDLFDAEVINLTIMNKDKDNGRSMDNDEK